MSRHSQVTHDNDVSIKVGSSKMGDVHVFVVVVVVVVVNVIVFIVSLRRRDVPTVN